MERPDDAEIPSRAFVVRKEDLAWRVVRSHEEVWANTARVIATLEALGGQRDFLSGSMTAP